MAMAAVFRKGVRVADGQGAKRKQDSVLEPISASRLRRWSDAPARVDRRVQTNANQILNLHPCYYHTATDTVQPI